MVKHVRVLLIVSALLPASLAGSLRESDAQPQFGSACLLHTTPFYQKLLGAGVFDSLRTQSSGQRPVPLLFKVARSFYYRSDKMRNDRWQTADETTRSYRGDCEDKAIWLYTQMRRDGYRDVALHIGRYAPDSRRFHMWVTCVDDSGRTLLLDPTIQRKPWEVTAFSEKNYKSLHIINGDDCVSL